MEGQWQRQIFLNAPKLCAVQFPEWDIPLKAGRNSQVESVPYFTSEYILRLLLICEIERRYSLLLRMIRGAFPRIVNKHAEHASIVAGASGAVLMGLGSLPGCLRCNYLEIFQLMIRRLHISDSRTQFSLILKTPPTPPRHRIARHMFRELVPMVNLGSWVTWTQKGRS